MPYSMYTICSGHKYCKWFVMQKHQYKWWE